MPPTSPSPSARRLAAELDSFLGDPTDPANTMSYRDIVRHDEDRSFPLSASTALEEWGFHRFVVPSADGGRLERLDDLFAACRTLSRRDVSLAVKYGATFLAACPVWLWGDEPQRDSLATDLLTGGVACFGLSERDHGSDLLATETQVVDHGGRLRLNGEKWPVGNAIRGRFATVFAREGGSRNFSLLLVDKSTLADAEYRTLPTVRTVGLRGHDLSGITYTDASIATSTVVGRRGIGFAQVLKTLQITRTATAALSLGTMDAVVRIATDHARNRRLYGAEIAALPAIRQQLLAAHLDLWISECVALPVARALTVAPERLSLWSSVIKYFVPVTAERTVAQMGTILGARSYLCEGVADGAFQKLQRDHAITSIFDGTTHVNLSHVAAQLPNVAAHCDDEPDGGIVESLFDLSSPTPPWRPDGRRLRLANGGVDEIGQTWPTAVQRLKSLAARAESTVGSRLVEACEAISRRRERFYREIGNPADPSRAQSDAHVHCVLHAAASCLSVWLHNREKFSGDFADGMWLLLCLARLAESLNIAVSVDEHQTATVVEMVLAGRASLSDLGEVP